MAEAAAERQRPYRSPDRWSLTSLTYSTFFERFVAPQRAAHEDWQETLRLFEAGDKGALARVARVINLNNLCGRPTNLGRAAFVAEWPRDREIQRLNPSRAVAGLEQRGFVLCDHHYRHNNVALTVEGFAEARRLGGVRSSEMIDLDRVQARWYDPKDFGLGLSRYQLRRDDDPLLWDDTVSRQIHRFG
ncbi:MAG: hypothetical protein ACJ8AI_10595 [Rhodopila sp.]